MKPSCAKCEASKANAKAAGHRDWHRGECFDCAGVDLDAYFASIGYAPDHAAAPVQLSLFGGNA
jgi:hypothetical protein